jgi:hypothetical protein
MAVGIATLRLLMATGRRTRINSVHLSVKPPLLGVALACEIEVSHSMTQVVAPWGKRQADYRGPVADNKRKPVAA